MTERVLGPTGSPRRRWTLFIPLVAAMLLGLMVIAGAQAVHDDGNIALEGNATTGTECTTDANTTPAGCDPHNPLGITTGEDWDRVFAGTDTADDGGFVTDTTLSGGLQGQGDTILPDNTKDIQAISGPNSWAWKQTATTSVQDKADLEHAYAAQYDDELYFGADRASNSGDTVMGFWFFRQEIGKVGPDANGNGTFTGNHIARGQLGAGERGDILIVSDFRQGGKAPQIQVYEWVTSGGSAATNLDLIAGSDTQPPTPRSCTQAPGEKNNDPPVPPVNNGDNLCATANQFIVKAPWKYDAKSNSGGTTGDNGTGRFGVATLMEGGIDLAAFGFGDTCFSSFMAETRSSHSVTSTLSDFVLGGFGACTASVTTTPANGSGTNLTDSDNPANGLPDIQIEAGATGVLVRDNASLSVTGVGTWSGTVAFFLCGPITSGTCDTGGVPAGTKNVSNTTTTAQSDQLKLTSVGRYCWRGFFDSGTAGVPDATDATPGECFEVKPRTPTLTTTAWSNDGSPGGTGGSQQLTPVSFGSPVFDKVNLSGTVNKAATNGGVNGTYLSILAPNTASNGAAATGTITATLKGPDGVNPPNCTDNATGTGATNPQTLTVAGDGNYFTAAFTPSSAGNYHWVASYSGDSPNTSSASHNTDCTVGAENVTVQQVPSSISTDQSVIPNDSATVSASAGGNVQGSVKFRLYNSVANCTATTPSDTVGQGGLLLSETRSLPGNQTSSTVSTTNTTISVDANATVAWLVEFTSTNPAQLGRKSVCVERTAITFTDDAGPGTP